MRKAAYRLMRGRNLRSVVAGALGIYGLDPVGIALVSDQTNCSFRVDVPGGGRFFLKVLDSSSCHGSEELKPALEWQDTLARESGARVPRVYRTPLGEPVCEVEDPGSGRHVCTLEEWIPGRRPGAEPSTTLSGRLGETAALFHRHSASFRMPQGLRTRTYGSVFPYSVPGFERAEPVLLFTPGSRTGLTPESCRVFARAGDLVGQEIESLYSRGAAPRLIHCDLHPWNTKTFRRTTAILDFEDTLLGHPEQDIATSLYYFRYRPRWADHLAAFRSGYSLHLDWPFDEPRRLERLIAGRGLLLANFVLGLEGAEASEMKRTYLPLVEDRMGMILS